MWDPRPQIQGPRRGPRVLYTVSELSGMLDTGSWIVLPGTWVQNVREGIALKRRSHFETQIEHSR